MIFFLNQLSLSFGSFGILIPQFRQYVLSCSINGTAGLSGVVVHMVGVIFAYEVVKLGSILYKGMVNIIINALKVI